MSEENVLGTLILGIVAGVAAPKMEHRVKRAVEDTLMAETPLHGVELRGISLYMCLLIAAVLSSILFSGGAIALTLGCVIGIFGPRLMTRLRAN